MARKKQMESKQRSEERQKILDLLSERWKEEPYESFGFVVTHMCYAVAGHTDLSMVSDRDLVEGLEQGWELK